jgi:hypothetical protein
VHARGIESYRHEVAEQRAEFHNLGDPITPPASVYRELAERFRRKIARHIRGKALLTRTTEAVRVVYYDVAARILEERRQVTPCLGGISNIHMNYNGEIWPCCVLGGDRPLGSVRDWDYDIQALLRSDQARESRKYIADGNCACPLANQWLNNVLLTPRHLLKVLYTMFLEFPRAARKAGTERRPGSVRPEDIKVRISGTGPRRAIVMQKLGTIPEETEADLPLFDPPDR